MGNELQIKKSKKRNREIVIVTYIFIGLFLCLIGYLVHFLVQDNTEIMNNPYNKRQDLLAERVVRGNILSKNGDVLAETVKNKKGEEVRSYPYDNLFCHAIGHFDNGKTGLELSYNVALLTSASNPFSSL